MGALSEQDAARPPNTSALRASFPQKGRGRRFAFGISAFVVLVTMGVLPPLLRWHREGINRAASLSNLRRLAAGLQLYAQDWDGCTMPPAYRTGENEWRTWPVTLKAYVAPRTVFSDPANPVDFADSRLRDPANGFPVPTSYALNRRFWNTFASGPFPLDNLELASQTVLFVEAGPLWKAGGQSPTDAPPLFARLDYGDTLDAVAGLCPFPSPHGGKMTVVAADGHTATVTVEHYRASDGPHDALYGRVGANIYNWNGGHPNGETDRPPRE